MSATKGYSKVQIALHWAVVALITIQYFFHDAISHAFRQVMRGEVPASNPLILSHVLIGVTILVLMVWRLGLRLRRGVPPLPAGGNPVANGVAVLTHWALYLVPALLALSGLVAWFGGIRSAAEVHELLKVALLAFIALHVLGALMHQFLLRDGLMTRMKVPAD